MYGMCWYSETAGIFNSYQVNKQQNKQQILIFILIGKKADFFFYNVASFDFFI